MAPQQTLKRWALTLLAVATLSTTAQAGSVGLSPLFPSGVDGKAILGVHQLLEAELEFLCISLPHLPL